MRTKSRHMSNDVQPAAVKLFGIWDMAFLWVPASKASRTDEGCNLLNNGTCDGEMTEEDASMGTRLSAQHVGRSPQRKTLNRCYSGTAVGGRGVRATCRSAISAPSCGCLVSGLLQRAGHILLYFPLTPVPVNQTAPLHCSAGMLCRAFLRMMPHLCMPPVLLNPS